MNLRPPVPRLGIDQYAHAPSCTRLRYPLASGILIGRLSRCGLYARVSGRRNGTCKSQNLQPLRVVIFDMSDTYDGGCLCGSVRFSATGKPNWILWCHCQSCRKHSGAPASVFVAFEHSAYSVTKGEITKFASSPGVKRGFCARCGSTLTCENEKFPSEAHFHVGAFDRAAELQPTGHIFREEQLPWLHLQDRPAPQR